MRVDPISVTKLFDGSSRDESIYYDKPILQYISPSDFISAFIDMPNIDKRHFSNVLVKRYESVYREDEIFVEMDWLEKLIKEIHQYLQLSTPSVSQVIMTFTHKNLLEVFNDVKFRTKVDEDNAESQE
jgi:hypothetical protein